jgi:toxin ParE1/3/4
MKHKVFLTDSASGDIVEIWRYIVLNDSVSAADKIKGALRKTIEGLRSLPQRGHVPPELERIGVSGYHEVHYKPYRIIYFVREKDVYVIAVFDGRRDIQEILVRRCFRA